MEAENKKEDEKKLIALACPGQGVNILESLKMCERYRKEVKEELEIVEDTLKTRFTTDMIESKDKKHDKWMAKTSNAQPAILGISYIIHKLIKKLSGIDLTKQANFLIGHSLGEYTTLVLTRIIKFQTGMELVKRRGELMEKIGAQNERGEGYVMKVLFFDRERRRKVIEEAISRGVLGCVNCDDQVVVSGRRSEVKDFIFDLKENHGIGLRLEEVKVTLPFHNKLFFDIEEELRDFLSKKKLGEQIRPIVSNLTGNISYVSTASVENTIKGNSRPVQWSSSVKTLKANGVSTIITLEPSRILSYINAKFNIRSIRSIKMLKIH